MTKKEIAKSLNDFLHLNDLTSSNFALKTGLSKSAIDKVRRATVDSGGANTYNHIAHHTGIKIVVEYPSEEFLEYVEENKIKAIVDELVEGKKRVRDIKKT